MSKKSSFERTYLDNGQINPKFVDVLSEDPPIQGQKYAIVSFITPESILKNRDLYFFERFVKQWDIVEARKEMTDFIHYISYVYNMDFNKLAEEYKTFINDSSDKFKKHEKTTIEEDYLTFLDLNEELLQKDFDKLNPFKTCVRGVKIRGVYSNEEDTKKKCEELQKIDKENNITYGEVGKWLSWDPDLLKTGNVQYAQDELNQLVHEQKKNSELKKTMFDKRVLDMKTKTIEENIKMAEQTNTVISQTLDPETGELITIRDNIDFSQREVAPKPH
jgi:hypothetical protein